MSDKIGSTVLSSKGGTSLSDLLDSEEIEGEEHSSVKGDEERSRGELLRWKWCCDLGPFLFRSRHQWRMRKDLSYVRS